MRSFNYLLLTFFILLFQSCQSDTADREDLSRENDFAVIANKRVGPVTAETKPEDIGDYFPDSVLQAYEVMVGEGETMGGTLVYPETPDELEIAWDPAQQKPAFIRIARNGARWSTPEGVTIGTSLQELVEMNGGPFEFNGFNWDYGGLVIDWQNGNLPAGLVVTLLPQRIDDMDEDFIGDQVLQSDMPGLEALDLRVAAMVVTF